jgi:phosphotransferase family enzyme
LPKSFPAAEVELVLGTAPVRWTPVESGGYGRVNAHWRVELHDGRSVFVKHADGVDAEEWLRNERRIYESVSGSFMPTYLGAHEDSGCVLLVLEDLSAAEWPPPWSSERIDAVLTVLERVRLTRPPPSLRVFEDIREDLVGWATVRADTKPLVSTGVCGAEWLGEALPALERAVEEAELAGDELVHLDVRSDNLCFVGGRTVLVDWNLACVGNGLFDVAFWLPSLRLEGGPQPWEILPHAGPLAAAVAGFFASRAGLPPPIGAPTVREFQRRQLEVALPWAARELGLPELAA